MKFLRFSSSFFLLVYFLAGTVSAAINIRVFSKDEGFYETNISKPRVYIQNLANSEAISNFFAYYYFTVENNKTPVLEDYYTPTSSVSLENLGNGNYRVKFNYTDITLQPGQTVPNTDGEVIGLHYTDWSNFDKTNDVSNNRQSIFTLNYSIPVYLSNGTLIFGDGVVPPTPSVPTLPPTAGNPGNFAVYSIERTDLRDRAHINAGDAGSIGTLEAGCDAVVSGNTLSGGEMTLRERAHITGNAVSKGRITTQNGVVIDGNRQENAQFILPNIARVNVVPGAQNITVSPDGSYTLNPGIYADFQAYSRSTVTIKPGSYTFRKFLIEPDVKLILQAGSGGQRIKIQVKETLRFGDRTIMSFAGGFPYSYSVNLYSSQTEQLFIGTDAVLYGLISAPDAEVHLYSRSTVNGSLFGKQVIVEPEATVCKPPVLADLFHSEWAMSPAFEPLVMEYKAVVPDATSTFLVTPVPLPGQTVTVNGQAPGTPINLTSAEQKITILLNHPEACGTTEYTLNVKKDGQHQIFVNDNSPCIPGSEDGKTWATAYKNLQVALDSAATQGREIWVAEGIYKPSRKAISTDPRSVTFLIQSGIEIIGGFLGTETTIKPEGSAYNTILSGDIAGNDDGISTWPPNASQQTLLSDNAYHVVTINSPAPSMGIRFENLCFDHGAANGTGENAIGAGIYNVNGSPTFEMCGLRQNLSASSGAGLYDNGGISSLTNSLFKNNVSNSGSGAGLFINRIGTTMQINASIFDNNTCKDTAGNSGGGAVFNTGSSISIVNSVFSRNTVASNGGAILTKSNNISLMNCTFSNNTSAKGGNGIIIFAPAVVTAVNTILWDPGAQSELKGQGFNISYSCIRGGYGGTANISTDPIFQGGSNLMPEGPDGRFGTLDDGLRLGRGSPCIGTGSTMGAPTVDIMNVEYTGSVEMGAYKYFVTGNGENTKIGRLDASGNFYECTPTIVHGLKFPSDIRIWAGSNFACVVRVFLEKDKRLKDKNSFTVNVQGLDESDNPIPGAAAIPLTLYKVGEQNGKYVFQSKTSAAGKYIVFSGSHLCQTARNPYAYVICTRTFNFIVSY